MTKLTQIKQNEIDLSWKGHPDFVFIHTTHTALISSVYVSSQVMLYSANSIWLLQFIQKTNGKKKYWAETMCCFHVFYCRQAYRQKAENHNTEKSQRARGRGGQRHDLARCSLQMRFGPFVIFNHWHPFSPQKCLHRTQQPTKAGSFFQNYENKCVFTLFWLVCLLLLPSKRKGKSNINIIFLGKKYY